MPLITKANLQTKNNLEKECCLPTLSNCPRMAHWNLLNLLQSYGILICRYISYRNRALSLLGYHQPRPQMVPTNDGWACTGSYAWWVGCTIAFADVKWAELNISLSKSKTWPSRTKIDPSESCSIQSYNPNSVKDK